MHNRSSCCCPDSLCQSRRRHQPPSFLHRIPG
jgi:hypothetical protein